MPFFRILLGSISFSLVLNNLAIKQQQLHGELRSWRGKERAFFSGSQLTSSSVFEGEFHRGVVATSKVDLSRPECHNFYHIQNISESRFAFDTVSKMFRPLSEIRNELDQQINFVATAKAAFPPAPVRRTLTYEDVATPVDWHGAAKYPWPWEYFWAMPLAVRTAERPVKVNTARLPSGKVIMNPANWKVASTSITQMLKDGVKLTTGPHDDSQINCNGKRSFEHCNKHTSFVSDAANANFTFALVRSPLDRFMGSIYEIKEWPSCDGRPCEDSVQKARDMAAKLLSESPHKYMHSLYFTQMYYLSSTDVDGRPFQWDKIIRLEQFKDEFAELKHQISPDIKLGRENTSGNRSLAQEYFKAVFSDAKTLCTVCKIYLQDFTCFGYKLPDDCSNEICSPLGITLS
eukprot:TRINITY_DN47585_c0_g1_i1.p1 TRINITY_DN47585_c0_g1~~TRINITY_DN47585_c0_g1_i1.p1  ORF type:complete len:404 (-),score=68.10 TRINITY_DN47585_c0_g1_i1:26-1237(-)